MKRLLLVDDDVECLAVAGRASPMMTSISVCNRRQGGTGGCEVSKPRSDPARPGHARHDRLRRPPDAEGRPGTVHDPGPVSVGIRDIPRQGSGLDLGAVDYITKPFDDFELKARVRAAIRTKQLQDILIEHAHIDPLTGLPNRRALMDRLQMEWARMQRCGGKLSFIMADIDHFKRVNDTYGHSIGDKVLQEVARIIAEQCRKSDLPARYGGEEFAVVVPNAGMASAVHLAERCRREIENVNLPAKGEPIRTTVSLGVADAAGMSGAQLLVDRADQALYGAKTTGRNRVAVWPESSQLCGE